MTKKIKLKQFGISPATQRKSGLKLNCCELSETKNPICNSSVPLDIANLEDVVGVDNYFIYRIDDVPEDEDGALNTEVGVGYLKNKRNSLYLIREFAFINIYANGEVGKAKGMTEFEIENHVTVSTYTPNTLRELSYLPTNFLWDGETLTLPEEKGFVYWDGTGISIEPLSNIKNDALNLVSTKNRPNRPPKGTILFNEITGTLQGYDGKVWKTIKWEDEE
tara:strand:- start:593 stop:1255 length:663 start_codon:yes stop_codon:yes gene_type:complete